MSDAIFTFTELRTAIMALAVIDRHGRDDDFAAVLRESTAATPSAELWGNATPGQQIIGGLLARRLSRLLDVPLESCEAAAAELFAPQRRRAIYQAILTYASELTARPTGNLQTIGATEAPRPILRLVPMEATV